MDAERIMERVRRLLAIANDPAASDNEQRIALEQAQRLMDRHAIEEWQLEEDHDAIEIIRRMIHLEANPCNWYMAELANIVALGNRCRASYGWRRARTTPRAKANAAWRNGYYRGFQEEVARRYAILRREMESDGAGRELVTVRGSQVDQWVEKHVTFSDSRPKLSKPTGSSQSAYRHGRQDGARQAIGLKETGKAADWALEK